MTGQIVIKRVRINGGGVTEVDHRDATHLSLFVQTDGSPPVWQQDTPADKNAWGIMMVEAAKLSMQYQYPIKPFK